MKIQCTVSLVRHATLLLLAFSTSSSQFSTLFAQGTAFTYQGRLNDGPNSANGHYDFQFILFSQSIFGNPAAPILTNANVAVNNGLFNATLDFGPAIFSGTNYWLDISVRTNGGAGFTTLSPRQKLTPAPYAIFAEKVGSGGLSAGIYGSAVTFSNNANSFNGNFSGSFSGDGSSLTGVWKIGGNAGTSSDFIGTLDDQPLDVRVNNARVMRYRLNADGLGFYTNAPNVIGGSSVNTTVTTDIVGATIAGGGGSYAAGGSLPNKVTADFGTVGGGRSNTASSQDATVGGGTGNIASGPQAIVGGGLSNTANGPGATISGGNFNVASGDISTVCGGEHNTASGSHSFAAGTSAKADDQGSFVWADSLSYDFHSTTANQFRVRATGGAAFVTAIDSSGVATAGVRVQSGDTSWSAISDRNQKKNFAAVDGEAVLEKLAAVPVQSWNYKWEADDTVPHLGPMAQDFKAAFYPGRDDKTISTLEFDGVELAAIQGLNQKLQEQRSELMEKSARINALEKELADLKAAVKRLSENKE